MTGNFFAAASTAAIAAFTSAGTSSFPAFFATGCAHNQQWDQNWDTCYCVCRYGKDLQCLWLRLNEILGWYSFQTLRKVHNLHVLCDVSESLLFGSTWFTSHSPLCELFQAFPWTNRWYLSYLHISLLCYEESLALWVESPSTAQLLQQKQT